MATVADQHAQDGRGFIGQVAKHFRVLDVSSNDYDFTGDSTLPIPDYIYTAGTGNLVVREVGSSTDVSLPITAITLIALRPGMVRSTTTVSLVLACYTVKPD